MVDRSLPLLGPLAASRCALRVRFDAPGGAPEGAVPAADSEIGRFRGDEGRRFAREVKAQLADLHPEAVTIEAPSSDGDAAGARAERLAATQTAMAAGAPLVIGGALPDDELGGRHGRPDVLVRGGRRPDGSWGYWPVLIANHRSLDAKRSVTLAHLEDPEVAVVALEDLRPDDLGDRALPPEPNLRRDRLALAHLWRLLEAAGQEAERPLAAVIGSERVVAWTDLAEREVLDAYDEAFAHRRLVLADPAPWPVPPVRVPECERCQWRDHCARELVRLDSTSLVPGVGAGQWQALHDAGVSTRAELAALPRHPDADDERIAAIEAACGLEWLPAAIDQAWAATAGGGRPHLRRDAGPLAVPVADLEVDLDMENALDGSVYLWGVLVDGEYRPVVDWSPASEDVQAHVFADFWAQVEQLTGRAWAEGASIAFYVWHEQAEIGAMVGGAAALARRGGPDRAEAIDALVSPPPEQVAADDPLAPLRAARFVDLLQVYRNRCVHGSGYGLKVVAPKAGFAWDDADPSGSESMLWHRTATTDPPPGQPDLRAEMRARLLRYNEDDVRATAAVRDWLRTADLPRLPG